MFYLTLAVVCLASVGQVDCRVEGRGDAALTFSHAEELEEILVSRKHDAEKTRLDREKTHPDPFDLRKFLTSRHDPVDLETTLISQHDSVDLETILMSQHDHVDLETTLVSRTVDLNKTLETQQALAELGKTGCKCVKVGKTGGCGCCVAITGAPLCVNVSYATSAVSVSLTVTLGKVVLLNQTISATNPPPVCFGVPHMHHLAGICVDVYGLTYQRNALHGCVKLSLSLAMVVKKDVKLGCFNIPLVAADGGEGVARWREAARVKEMVEGLRRARTARLQKIHAIEKLWENL